MLYFIRILRTKETGNLNLKQWTAIEINGNYGDEPKKLVETMEMNGKPKKTNGNNGDEWKA